MLQHERCYISCNCNQTPTAADWGHNGLICYAASNAIQIYNPKWGSGGRIIATLEGHTKRVNSVRWLRNSDNELVSGSADHTVIVWTKLEDQNYKRCVLTGHESNVNLVDGIHENGRNVVVAVGMDSAIKIWVKNRGLGEYQLLQDLKYSYSICVGVSIYSYNYSIILACAMDNSKIDIYVESAENELFTKGLSLTGHEDWVRGLDFTIDSKGTLLLASSSQDYYIRLWRFISESETTAESNFTVVIKNTCYKVQIDSVLTGHEGWIYSVHWHPTLPQLLSSSLDKSMIIWELDSTSNLWIEKIRVGEVGGNTLGFYGGVFGPDGESILGHGYNGAFHIWKNDNEEWVPCVTVGGHFGEVTDLGWEPKGEFLVSVGADQTTRVHAPWSREGDKVTWHEIARPQVHGYDLSSIAVLSRYKFASSAEEKIIRTFEAPTNFVENFARICNISDEVISGGSAPKGASVPSLGLSNKAVFTDKGGVNEEGEYFTAVALTEPPTEETLVQNTLWPEIQKLYGHGYEVYSLASSPDGEYLASACKATTSEHAAILLWETSSWREIQKLVSHSLTVVQMAFSPNGRHLLSVSRDRRWSLFSKNSENSFELLATTDKKTGIHTRIIWCCSWSHDSEYFATGSRDGKVVIWARNPHKLEKNILGEYESVNKHLELKNEAITALSFAPGFVSESYLLAVGLEMGAIYCYKWSRDGWDQLLSMDRSLAHHLTVKRLAFRSIFGKAGEKDGRDDVLQLASCGSDHTVIVHNIFIK